MDPVSSVTGEERVCSPSGKLTSPLMSSTRTPLRDTTNQLMVGGGGNKRSSDVKDLSPLSDHNVNRETEIETVIHTSQSSTPKKIQDCDTGSGDRSKQTVSTTLAPTGSHPSHSTIPCQESDTTADYESAGEVSPWKENLSALAESLAGVHLTTPTNTTHIKPLSHFPFSPLSGEDEDEDEEVISITSNNSGNSSLKSLSLLKDDLLPKLEYQSEEANTLFVNSARAVGVSDTKEQGIIDAVDNLEGTTHTDPSLSLQQPFNASDSLNIISPKSGDKKVVSPFAEFEDAGPACLFHSDIMSSMGLGKSSPMPMSNTSLSEDCRHHKTEESPRNQARIAKDKEAINNNLQEYISNFNDTIDEVPIDLAIAPHLVVESNLNKSVSLKDILSDSSSQCRVISASPKTQTDFPSSVSCDMLSVSQGIEKKLTLETLPSESDVNQSHHVSSLFCNNLQPTDAISLACIEGSETSKKQSLIKESGSDVFVDDTKLCETIKTDCTTTEVGLTLSEKLVNERLSNMNGKVSEESLPRTINEDIIPPSNIIPCSGENDFSKDTGSTIKQTNKSDINAYLSQCGALETIKSSVNIKKEGSTIESFIQSSSFALNDIIGLTDKNHLSNTPNSPNTYKGPSVSPADCSDSDAVVKHGQHDTATNSEGPNVSSVVCDVSGAFVNQKQCNTAPNSEGPTVNPIGCEVFDAVVNQQCSTSLTFEGIVASPADSSVSDEVVNQKQYNTSPTSSVSPADGNALNVVATQGQYTAPISEGSLLSTADCNSYDGVIKQGQHNIAPSSEVPAVHPEICSVSDEVVTQKHSITAPTSEGPSASTTDCNMSDAVVKQEQHPIAPSSEVPVVSPEICSVSVEVVKQKHSNTAPTFEGPSVSTTDCNTSDAVVKQEQHNIALSSEVPVVSPEICSVSDEVVKQKHSVTAPTFEGPSVSTTDCNTSDAVVKQEQHNITPSSEVPVVSPEICSVSDEVVKQKHSVTAPTFEGPSVSTTDCITSDAVVKQEQHNIALSSEVPVVSPEICSVSDEVVKQKHSVTAPTFEGPSVSTTDCNTSDAVVKQEQHNIAPSFEVPVVSPEICSVSDEVVKQKHSVTVPTFEGPSVSTTDCNISDAVVKQEQHPIAPSSEVPAVPPEICSVSDEVVKQKHSVTAPTFEGPSVSTTDCNTSDAVVKQEQHNIAPSSEVPVVSLEICSVSDEVVKQKQFNTAPTSEDPSASTADCHTSDAVVKQEQHIIAPSSEVPVLSLENCSVSDEVVKPKQCITVPTSVSPANCSVSDEVVKQIQFTKAPISEGPVVKLAVSNASDAEVKQGQHFTTPTPEGPAVSPADRWVSNDGIKQEHASETVLGSFEEKHPISQEGSVMNASDLVSPLKICTAKIKEECDSTTEVTVEQKYVDEDIGGGNLSLSEICNLIETTFNVSEEKDNQKLIENGISSYPSELEASPLTSNSHFQSPPNSSHPINSTESFSKNATDHSVNVQFSHSSNILSTEGKLPSAIQMNSPLLIDNVATSNPNEMVSTVLNDQIPPRIHQSLVGVLNEQGNTPPVQSERIDLPGALVDSDIKIFSLDEIQASNKTAAKSVNSAAVFEFDLKAEVISPIDKYWEEEGKNSLKPSEISEAVIYPNTLSPFVKNSTCFDLSPEFPPTPDNSVSSPSGFIRNEISSQKALNEISAEQMHKIEEAMISDPFLDKSIECKEIIDAQTKISEENSSKNANVSFVLSFEDGDSINNTPKSKKKPQLSSGNSRQQTKKNLEYPPGMTRSSLLLSEKENILESICAPNLLGSSEKSVSSQPLSVLSSGSSEKFAVPGQLPPAFAPCASAGNGLGDNSLKGNSMTKPISLQNNGPKPDSPFAPGSPKVFQEAVNFDFEFLSKICGKQSHRNKLRESLFLKFDPLAVASPHREPTMLAPPSPRPQVTIPDSSSDAVSTPPGGRSDERRENMLVCITPGVTSPPELPSSSPSSNTSTPRTRHRQSPVISTLRQEVLSKEISKLQELTIEQENCYQEQIAACLCEIDELRTKVAYYEEHNPTEQLEQNLAVALQEREELQAKLVKQEQKNEELLDIISEYDQTVERLLSAENKHKAEMKTLESIMEKLKKDKRSSEFHLSNLEIAFNDIHSKYEKAKHVISLFQKNEEEYKKAIEANRITFDENKEKYNKLKEHVTEKLDQANREHSEMQKAHQLEIAKLNALIKILQVQHKSLERNLEQKDRELQELTNICDDLMKRSSM